MRRCSISVLLLATACTDPAVASIDGGGVDAGVVDAAPAVLDAGLGDGGASSPCSPDDLIACAYHSRVQAEPGTETSHTLHYTDEAGLERTIEIQVRLPAEMPGPVPGILWSHGGASGISSANGVGREWSDPFVRAGYAVIAIAHNDRSAAEYDALAAELGISDTPISCTTVADCSALGAEVACDAGGCRSWKHLNWDRPHDARVTLDFLERETAPDGMYADSIDPARIVYAGHSAGAGSTMMIAGATRQFAGVDTVLMDDRPIAFLSASPQGPGEDDFNEASFAGELCETLARDPSICLTRPHLTLTGVGDDTDGVGENRRRSFDLAPATALRWLGFINEEAARHTTFAYGIDACTRYAEDESLDPAVFPARCDIYRDWLSSIALAFLDAVTRDSAEASAWLSSDHATVMSGGALSFEHR